MSPRVRVTARLQRACAMGGKICGIAAPESRVLACGGAEYLVVVVARLPDGALPLSGCCALAKGVYIVNLTDGETSLSSKITKQ